VPILQADVTAATAVFTVLIRLLMLVVSVMVVSVSVFRKSDTLVAAAMATAISPVALLINATEVAIASDPF
jgi:hypothetical protein